MPSQLRAMRILVIAMLAATGCESSDDRFLEFSAVAADRQQQQNAVIAAQSEALAKQSQRITDASRELVTADATARAEMFRAHQQLTSKLHEERAQIDLQRSELERERREIATQRAREPVIAAAMEQVGMLLACLFPLLVAAYALSQLDRSPPEADELADLLAQELVGNNQHLSSSTDSPLLGSEQQRLPTKDAESPNDLPTDFN